MSDAAQALAESKHRLLVILSDILHEPDAQLLTDKIWAEVVQPTLDATYLTGIDTGVVIGEGNEVQS